MKKPLLVAGLICVGAVAVGSPTKSRKSSTTLDLPVCNARMQWGTACVWMGLAELSGPVSSVESAVAPASDPRQTAWAALKNYSTDTGWGIIETFPTEFEVPASEISLVWGRAQSFIAQHSSMKIQTATDWVIETYNPRERYEFGYEVTKTPLDAGGFSVKVTCISLASKIRVARNARALAYYIVTGKVPPGFEG